MLEQIYKVNIFGNKMKSTTIEVNAKQGDGPMIWRQDEEPGVGVLGTGIYAVSLTVSRLMSSSVALAIHLRDIPVCS